MRSNENKISDGYRERAPNRSGSVLIMGKRGPAAGSRSLDRLVRCGVIICARRATSALPRYMRPPRP